MNKLMEVEKYLSEEEIRVLTNFSMDSRLSYKVENKINKDIDLKRKYKVLKKITIK